MQTICRRHVASSCPKGQFYYSLAWRSVRHADVAERIRTSRLMANHVSNLVDSLRLHRAQIAMSPKERKSSAPQRHRQLGNQDNARPTSNWNDCRGKLRRKVFRSHDNLAKVKLPRRVLQIRIHHMHVPVPLHLFSYSYLCLFCY